MPKQRSKTALAARSKGSTHVEYAVWAGRRRKALRRISEGLSIATGSSLSLCACLSCLSFCLFSLLLSFSPSLSLSLSLSPPPLAECVFVCVCVRVCVFIELYVVAHAPTCAHVTWAGMTFHKPRENPKSCQRMGPTCISKHKGLCYV